MFEALAIQYARDSLEHVEKMPALAAMQYGIHRSLLRLNPLAHALQQQAPGPGQPERVIAFIFAAARAADETAFDESSDRQRQRRLVELVHGGQIDLADTRIDIQHCE